MVDDLGEAVLGATDGIKSGASGQCVKGNNLTVAGGGTALRAVSGAEVRRRGGAAVFVGGGGLCLDEGAAHCGCGRTRAPAPAERGV